MAKASEAWEILPESALTDLCSAQLRKVKLKVVPSFPNLDSWEFSFGVPIGCWSFLSQGQLFPSYLSCFVSWELSLAFCLPETCRLLVLAYTGSSTIRLGAQKYGQTEMWVALHLQWGSYHLLPALRGTKSFFLLTIFGEWLWILGEKSPLHPLQGCLFVQSVVQYFQEYLAFVLAETWPDIWKDFL